MHGRPRFFVSHGTSDQILPIDQCSRVIVPRLTVLVTGGSGFVGSHVILQLLERRARGAHDGALARARSGRARDARGRRRRAGGRLSFFAADLERDDGWPEAVAGCDYVLHVASPMPPVAPKTEDEVIVPARDGVLRVLRAARDAEVKRVVLTSSCGAIYYGHPLQKAPFDETSWTNLDGEMSAYVKSKAIAERAAWDFVAAEGGALELAVVNPAGIFGPVLGAGLLGVARPGEAPDERHARLPAALLRRRRRARRGRPAPARDDQSRRRRASASSPSRASACRCSTSRRVLKARLGDAAKKVPTRQLPNWVVRLAARFDPAHAAAPAAARQDP